MKRFIAAATLLACVASLSYSQGGSVGFGKDIVATVQSEPVTNVNLEPLGVAPTPQKGRMYFDNPSGLFKMCMDGLSYVAISTETGVSGSIASEASARSSADTNLHSVKLSTGVAVPTVLINLSTVTTALSGKRGNTESVPTEYVDLSTVTAAIGLKWTKEALEPVYVDLSTVTSALSGKIGSGSSASGELSGTFPSPSLSGKVDAPLVAKSSVAFEDGNFSVAGTTLVVVNGRVGVNISSPSASARLDVNGATYLRGRVGILTAPDATYNLVVSSGIRILNDGLRMWNGTQDRAFLISRWATQYASMSITESGNQEQLYGVCHATITISLSGVKTAYINFAGSIKTDNPPFRYGINVLKDGQFLTGYNESKGILTCFAPLELTSECNASFSLILPPDGGAVTGDPHDFCITTASPDGAGAPTVTLINDTYTGNTFSVQEGSPPNPQLLQ